MNYKPHTLREKSACTHLGIGRTKFRNLVKDGILPKPYKAGGCSLWKTSDLEQAFDVLLGAANDNTPVNHLDSWSDV